MSDETPPPKGSPERALDARLDEQVHYYRQRAPEYDDWWQRRRQWDLGPDGNRGWWAEVAALEAIVAGAFADAPRAPEVLELAGGTGNWTVQLVPHSGALTVVDASPEMLAINARRLRAAGADDRVTYQRADLFRWAPPPGTADMVFFSFWLSHVPEARVADFLAGVRRALRPGGQLVVLDTHPGAASTSPGERRGEWMTRRLSGGEAFEIVKRVEGDAELAARLEAAGFTARTGSTGEHFVWAVARAAR